MNNKIIFSCFLASCLEMYDFAVFGFFVPVLHQNYLTFVDKTNALIIGYILFTIGFVFRPIGSLIFGYIGDTIGRKKALTLSVGMMGSSSIMLAFTPSYDSIGIISCYLIVLARVIQGVSVGGEHSGTLIYSMEHSDKKEVNFTGGIVIAGGCSGVLLASLVSNITQLEFMPDNSWRFAFLLGFCLSIIGYFIRKNFSETPEFLKIKELKSNSIPLVEGIKNHYKEFFIVISLSLSNSTFFYLALIFFPNFFNTVIGTNIQYFPTIIIVITIIFAPIFCILSNKIKKTNIICCGFLLTGCVSIYGMNIIKYNPSVTNAIIFFCLYGLCYSSLSATVNVFAIEVFPTKYRFSCGAFSFCLEAALLGGSAPLIGALIMQYKSDFYLYLYIFTITCIGFITAFRYSMVSSLTKNKV